MKVLNFKVPGICNYKIYLMHNLKAEIDDLILNWHTSQDRFFS